MITLAQAIVEFKQFLALAVANGQTKPRNEEFHLTQLAHLEKLVQPTASSDESVGAHTGTGHLQTPKIPGCIELASVTPLHLMRLPQKYHCIRVCMRLWKFHCCPWPKQIKLPKCGRRKRINTKAQSRRLMRAAPFMVRWMLWLIRQTTMRPQEVRELTWDKVFENDAYIEIEDFKAKHLRKDELDVRTVPLPPKVCRLFRFVRSRIKIQPGQFVFVNRLGRRWTAQSLRRSVAKARRKAGFPPGMKEPPVAYHERHSAATELANKGIDPILLAEIMGHTSLETTRQYIKRSAKDRVAAVYRSLGYKSL